MPAKSQSQFKFMKILETQGKPKEKKMAKEFTKPNVGVNVYSKLPKKIGK